MKTKINIDDFLVLINWVKMFFMFEGKTFNHQSLFDQAETYKLNNTPLNTQIHPIDNLMIDAYQIYVKLKSTSKKVMQVMDSISAAGIVIPFVTKDMMLNETQNYERIFEELIENYKYEDPEIRGIQKGFLSEKMKEYILSEDYESAARLRDMIKEG